jgi:hypothetical protein
VSGEVLVKLTSNIQAIAKSWSLKSIALVPKLDTQNSMFL